MADSSPSRRLGDIPAEAARRWPDRLAVVCDGVEWSFTQLSALVDDWSRRIAAATGPGRPVALLAGNRAEYVVAYYAIPAAGRTLLPLNPRLHPLEWDALLDRTGASLVLGDAALLASLAASTARRVVTLDEPEQIGPPTTRIDAATPAPAWLLFTSGTSGRPKGVPLTDTNLLASFEVTAAGRPVRDNDVFLTAFSLCHVAGYSVPLHHDRGCPTVIMSKFDPASLVDLVARYDVTTLSLAPTMIDSLLQTVTPSQLDLLRRQIRSIGYGSSPIPRPLLERTLDEVGCELNQGFGMTELAGNATFLNAADHRTARDDRPELLASAGRPPVGVEVTVLDDDGSPSAPGSLGELAVRGPQVFTGYLDADDDTGTRVDGWFRTGDLGHVSHDGYVFIVDRRKDLIVSGGENVSSREVEDVLLTHPAVREVAVVGLPDARWGELVTAVVVPAGDAPTLEALQSLSRAHLGAFKTVRRLIVVEELPRTSSGKVRKAELRDRFGAA